MGGFAQYYVEFLGKLWNNICEWFMNHISIIVNVFYGDFAEAERTIKRLLPIDSISFAIFLLAPEPTASIIITALTPIIIPKLVRIERILFIFNDTVAIFNIDLKSSIMTFLL